MKAIVLRNRSQIGSSKRSGVWFTQGALDDGWLSHQWISDPPKP